MQNTHTLNVDANRMVLDYLVASFIDSSYCGPHGYDGLLGVSGALVGGITEHIQKFRCIMLFLFIYSNM